MSLQEKICKTAAEQLSETDGIVAAYLFGSVLEESGRASKDIDLAFLLDEERYKEDPLKAQAGVQMFAARLSAATDMKTDVTILNGASLEMAYEIITTGRTLFPADQNELVNYECKIKGMYFDFKPFLDDLRNSKPGSESQRA